MVHSGLAHVNLRSGAIQAKVFEKKKNPGEDSSRPGLLHDVPRQMQAIIASMSGSRPRLINTLGHVLHRIVCHPRRYFGGAACALQHSF
jgi:hypothetical protein